MMHSTSYHIESAALCSTRHTNPPNVLELLCVLSESKNKMPSREVG